MMVTPGARVTIASSHLVEPALNKATVLSVQTSVRTGRVNATLQLEGCDVVNTWPVIALEVIPAPKVDVKPTAASARTRIEFEVEDCGRCGGSGLFGPLCVDGGRCFKCGGGKKQHTRAGASALKKFNAVIEANTKRVDDLVVGDKIKMGGLWYGVLTAPEFSKSGRIDCPTNRALTIFNRRDGGRKNLLIDAEDTVIVYSDDVWDAAATRVAKLKGATVIYS